MPRPRSTAFSIQLSLHHCFCPTCSVPVCVPVPIAADIVKQGKKISCINAHSFLPSFDTATTSEPTNGQEVPS